MVTGRQRRRWQKLYLSRLFRAQVTAISLGHVSIPGPVTISRRVVPRLRVEEPPNPCGAWERLIPKGGERLLTGGVRKCLLVETGFLTMSPSLIGKEAWGRGVGEIQCSWRKSQDHNELSFKHMQAAV